MNKDRKKALIIGQPNSWVETLGEVLKQSDYHVASTSESGRGIHLAKTIKFDLIFLDYAINVAKGMDVLSKILLDDKSSKVVVVTHNKNIGDARQYFRLGACDYIEKSDDYSTYEKLFSPECVLCDHQA